MIPASFYNRHQKYLEHANKSELSFLVFERVIKYPQSEQFLVHTHEIIVGIEIFRYLSNLRYDILGVCPTRFFFKHKISIVSQIVTNFVTCIAKTLETCILSFL